MRDIDEIIGTFVELSVGHRFPDACKHTKKPTASTGNAIAHPSKAQCHEHAAALVHRNVAGDRFAHDLRPTSFPRKRTSVLILAKCSPSSNHVLIDAIARSASLVRPRNERVRTGLATSSPSLHVPLTSRFLIIKDFGHRVQAHRFAPLFARRCCLQLGTWRTRTKNHGPECCGTCCSLLCTRENENDDFFHFIHALMVSTIKEHKSSASR